jgi:hypothetical protein
MAGYEHMDDEDMDDTDDGTLPLVEDDPEDDAEAPLSPHGGGVAMLDLTEPEDNPEAEEMAVVADQVTGQVVRALLTAGLNKGPLPAHGQQTILDLIHNSAIQSDQVLVKTPEDVRKFIKILVDSDDCLLEHIALEFQEDDPQVWKDKGGSTYGTNALDACVDMVRSVEAASWMVWECGGPEEGITCPITGDRARRREQALRAKAENEGWEGDFFYVPVTFFSDKTHLNVRGTHKTHPGFLRLCGWKQPFCYTRRAARLIVMLPDPPSISWDRTTEPGSKFSSATAWKDFLKMRKQDLHHTALESVLHPLKEHSRYFCPTGLFYHIGNVMHQAVSSTIKYHTLSSHFMS